MKTQFGNSTSGNSASNFATAAPQPPYTLQLRTIPPPCPPPDSIQTSLALSLCPPPWRISLHLDLQGSGCCPPADLTRLRDVLQSNLWTTGWLWKCHHWTYLTERALIRLADNHKTLHQKYAGSKQVVVHTVRHPVLEVKFVGLQKHVTWNNV